MKPEYTYRNKHGVFYFRRVLLNGTNFDKVEIRTSLRTRDIALARLRSYQAWMIVDSMIESGCSSSYAIRSKIQKSLTNNKKSGMARSKTEERFGPQLVQLSKVLESYDLNYIQDILGQVVDAEEQVFAPFKGGICTFYKIQHDEYSEDDNTPEDINYFADGSIVLTSAGVESAFATQSGTFQIDEFYSYYPGGYINGEFTNRIVPVEACIFRVSQLLIKKKIVEKLNFYPQSNPVITPNQSTSGHKLILDEVLRYCDKKEEKNRWTEKTRKGYESVFRTFIEIVGNKPLIEINQSDIEKFEDKLRYLPPNRNKLKDFSGLNAVDASDLNQKQGGQVLSDRSKQKYLHRLTGLFKMFSNQGKCSHNFFAGIESYDLGDEDDIDKRDPFTIEDLSLMFDDEKAIKIFNEKNYLPSRVWGALIALFTGARAEEIYSLLLENIGNEDDTDFFSIKNMARHNRVKNAAARRKIPIHPKLIELGLMEYIEKSRGVQKNIASPMLFPDIEKSKDHGWSRNTTRWFNEKFLTGIGVKTDKKVFHSYRHSVVDTLKRAPNLNEMHASQYIGHKDQGGPFWKNKNYGSRFTPSEIIGITECIAFDVDFSALKANCLDKLVVRRKKRKKQKSE